MAAYRLRKEEPDRELLKDIHDDLLERAINQAITGMITSNKSVAEAMQQVPVHAATDVTGFGLKGHATSMAELSRVNIIIDKLWVIGGTPVLSEIFGYPLLSGESKETAGGILIAIAKKDTDDLQSELDKRKIRHVEVGYVTDGNGEVNIHKNAEVVEA
jgi:selenide,water dikinase